LVPSTLKQPIMGRIAEIDAHNWLCRSAQYRQSPIK